MSNLNLKTKYTATKLKVREDAENKYSNDEILDANSRQAKHLLSLGFISGGTWAIAEGDVYSGYLTYLPEAGKNIFLVDGHEWFRSSPVVEIKKQVGGKFYIKTANSIYRLEKYATKRVAKKKTAKRTKRATNG